MSEDPRPERFMRAALQLARKAMEEGEAPVGAVVVKGQTLLGSGYNRRERAADPTGHAEILAIREAAEKLGDWRLDGCDLFVTIEPCAMCVGACLMARIASITFGAREPKWGALGSAADLLRESRFPHRISLVEGVLAEESAALLKTFFASLRAAGKTT